MVPARLAQKNLLRLKPETAFADAALVEPLACVVQGVEEAQLRAGRHVLVIGTGPIGLIDVHCVGLLKSWLHGDGGGPRRGAVANRAAIGRE